MSDSYTERVIEAHAELRKEIERLEADIAELQSALMSIMQHANQAMTSSVDSKEQT